MASFAPRRSEVSFTLPAFSLRATSPAQLLVTARELALITGNRSMTFLRDRQLLNKLLSPYPTVGVAAVVFAPYYGPAVLTAIVRYGPIAATLAKLASDSFEESETAMPEPFEPFPTEQIEPAGRQLEPRNPGFPTPAPEW
jgi:hypothetical protein